MESTGLKNLIDELSNKLAESIYQTIQVLSAIASMNEKFYIGSHSRFVAEKSRLIAKTLGMNDTDIFEIETAALLHDIGKIRFSEHLNLLTPNEMNDKEFEQYKMHPELGRQILEKHSGFDTISDIIFQHHEKLDGSGYPRYLTKETIHPGAKIISVVNAYHNKYAKIKREQLSTKTSIQFTSSDAYMKSTDTRFAGAMNYLYSKRGVLFESKVVDIFSDIIMLERKNMGKMVVVRVPANVIKPGMIIAEDYYTTFGLLIAARGEEIRQEMIKPLIKFAEAGEIPQKILVMK